MANLEEEYEVSESIFGATKKRKVDSACAKVLDAQARNELDQLIARGFYSGGLPFVLARNPHYLRSFTFAANHNIDGYVPPGYDSLRTTLLRKEKQCVDQSLVPLQSNWKAKGVTIVADGGSDPRKKPLVNIMVCCESDSVFVKGVNRDDVEKDKYFIVDELRKVIDKVVHDNVVQVVTKRFFECEEEIFIAMSGYFNFYLSDGPFNNLNAIRMRGTMDPSDWWANFGASTPLLQRLAICLLGQPASSSCCERHWKTYSFVHSLKRNQMFANDLLFIHNNLRLLSGTTPEEYLDEKTKMWDVGRDESGILELAHLSFDEQELESMFFKSDLEYVV